MRRLHSSVAFLAAAIGLAAATPSAVSASVITVTFTSTTNNAYNNRAYFKNTGISVHAGDILNLAGSGQIYVGGGYYVRSNFDMGLISPLNSSFVVRDYYGLGNNYTGTPYPLTGESVLFSQQKSSLNDQHDLILSAPVLSDGYLYLGMFDNYFADNTGSHTFAVQVTPEPSSITYLGLFVVLFCRHYRRTNSSVRGV